MAEKSPRRLQLERSVADDPSDSFLGYALALQCLRDGDLEEGRERLRSLMSAAVPESIAAHQQLGQSYLEAGEEDQAREVLRRGIEQARLRGDQHAAAEMEGLLAQLD